MQRGHAKGLWDTQWLSQVSKDERALGQVQGKGHVGLGL